MMEKPKLSIIMPLFNLQDYIDRAIKSIIMQSYQNYELILVDDGSFDNTYEKCLCWERKDQRIKVLRQKNSGPSAARNYGLANSDGEYIYFCDGDDYLDANYLQDIFNNCNNNDLLISGYLIRKGIDEVGFFSDHNIELNLSNDSEKEWLVKQSLLTNNVVSGFLWNKVFKRDLVMKSGAFEEDIYYSEDTQFLIKYINICQSACVIKSSNYYNYNLRSGSLTISKYNPKKVTVLEANELIMKQVHSHDLEQIVSSRLLSSKLMLLINIIETKNLKTKNVRVKLYQNLKSTKLSLLFNPYVVYKEKISLMILKISFGLFEFFITNFHKKKFKN